MASVKMTFTIREDVAGRLLRSVAARDRSRYVSQAIAEKLRAREEALIRACDAANAEADVLAIEKEWDAVSEAIDEPWSDASEG